jgi:hypothetical protein
MLEWAAVLEAEEQQRIVARSLALLPRRASSYV